MSNTRDTLGDQATLDALVSHTLTEFEEDGVSTLRNYAFSRNDKIEKITLPALTNTGTYAFQNCTSLQEVNLPVVTTIGNYAFQNCKNLSKLTAPSITRLNNYAFSGCSKLTDINLSSVTQLNQYCLENTGIGKIIAPECTSLGTYVCRGNRTSVVDITQHITISSNTFNNACALCHLILRSETLCALSNVNAFTNTGIQAGYGWIYVPTNLVDSYKSASNWSTFADQIVSIDEYPKTLQIETITDSWSDIITACNNGSHSTKYNVGDIKVLDVGGTQLPMQIVAKDTDVLSAGGAAPLTWISVGLLDTHQMNTTNDTTGGWEDCLMRSYLRDTIYPQIDSVVKNAIKPVTKSYYDTQSPTTKTITDTVWIPSAKEIYGGSSYESSGVDYTAFFTSNNDRIKKYGLINSASYWWLRSAYSAASFRFVYSSGAINYYSASASYGVALGFCL